MPESDCGSPLKREYGLVPEKKRVVRIKIRENFQKSAVMLKILSIWLLTQRENASIL